MEIKRNRNTDELVVAVCGKIDTTTAPQFDEGVRPYLDGIASLVLDFAHVDYVSSAGLRVLLSLQKVMNKQGAMKLIHVNDAVGDVFEVTGFNEILTIEKGE